MSGVQALHAAGKLHRDIKPSNVLVAADGRVVILDFGVATEFSRVVDENLSEEHEMVGTARYMAPEQASRTPTAASDWYSVGVVLYEALVGRPPFVGTSVDVLSMKMLGEPVPAAQCVEGVPSDLDALCSALLNRESEMRPNGPRSPAHPRCDAKLVALSPGRSHEDPALVARQDALRALRESFEAVCSGHPMTVRVGGASGMGKSAVVQHFLDELVERARPWCCEDARTSASRSRSRPLTASSMPSAATSSTWTTAGTRWSCPPTSARSLECFRS